MEKSPLHLKNPELQQSEEVQNAVEKQERLTDEKISNDPSTRIEAYMGRLENIFLNPDKRVRERNLEMFRDKIFDALIIKPEVASEQILKDEAKVALDRGHGLIEITEEMKNSPEAQEQAEAVIKRQKASLVEWMDYLTSDDTSSYDPWFKYYLWNSITKLQTLVKIERIDEKTGEKSTTAEYPKRTTGTLKTFPDIFRGKLSQIYDKYNKYITGEKTDEVAKQYFQRNFAKTYADESLDYVLNASVESKERTHGEWVKYEKGNMDDAEKMISSLQDKYTDWCIEGEGVGRDKLNEGDIFIYYTFDTSGSPIDPRICIRMSEDRIAEVRGISGGKSQEVEQVFMDEIGEGGSILGNKLNEFGGEADTYKKREADMKAVTRLMKKNHNNEAFTKDDLIFLYEINAPIEGFGYEKDPRVEELRGRRNKDLDCLIIFECTADQIAHNSSGLNENTKVYVGPLEPGIFKKLPDTLEHIYTSFPEGKIQKYQTEIGGKTKDQLKSELEEKNIDISDWGNQLLAEGRHFTLLERTEKADLVRLTVRDLGFENGATTDQVYATAQNLGLDLCPAEIGPRLRLAYSGDDWMLIAMKQISVWGGPQDIFKLDGSNGRLRLHARNAHPLYDWTADDQFVFLLRKRNFITS